MSSRELYSYFNLTGDPFTKEISTEKLVLLPSVERSLSAAELLVETRGIGVMTGKSGTGKSCILRLLVDRLQPGLYKSFYLCHTSVAIVEFYTHLCDIFGLEPAHRRAPMFRALKEHILTMASRRRIHPVLIIDEAHLLNNDILSEIRLLTNFHTDSLNALTVLLCGNEHLPRRFGLSALESLASAITVSVPIEPLSKEETFSYVEYRLSACGASSPLLTSNALALIHQASGGTMRTIGTITTAALRRAWMSKSTQVEAEHDPGCPHPVSSDALLATPLRRGIPRAGLVSSNSGTTRVRDSGNHRGRPGDNTQGMARTRGRASTPVNLLPTDA